MAIFCSHCCFYEFLNKSPSNKQALPKVYFEISVQRIYLKQLGRSQVGGGGYVMEKYYFISSSFEY